VKTKGILVAIILVVVLISSTAGCIIGGQSKAKVLVDALHNGMKNDTSSNLKAWRETEIDKDTIRVMFTKENATSTTYYDLTVKWFHTATDATKFVDSINQGYMLTNSADSSSFGSNSAYSLITGHKPTNADTYMKIDSIIPAKVSMIFQMDELVMYGPVTIITSGSSQSQSNQKPISSAPAGNQTLNTIVEEYHDVLAESSTAMPTWKVTWIDANTVKIDVAIEQYNASAHTTSHANANYTIKRFNSINDATNYLNSQTSGYNLASTTSPNDSAYIRATGHKPSTYERWIKINENRDDYADVSSVTQTDNFVASLHEIAYTG